MMQKFLNAYTSLCFVLLFFSCTNQTKAPNPWGEGNDVPASNSIQLDDIISNGELIMVTIGGPETYYDYHGHGMGLHYLLCEKFCETIGVSVRVDICNDTTEMVRRIKEGEADIAALPFTGNEYPELSQCPQKTLSKGWHWLVNKDNKSLRDTLSNWLTDDLVSRIVQEETFLLSSRSVTRHVYSPMLNRTKGIISNYDGLFQRYSAVARWDWRLLAAQCYQESTFDPRAHSWAGACGLMQIMPATADEIGLARADIYDPEKNIAAATRYIAKLTKSFDDIANQNERIKFVLASYNGGTHHIRDAMALTAKHGGSQYRWADVRENVLRLQRREYYSDPVVKHGYMRGSETADYVDRIWNRWNEYRGVKTSVSASSATMPGSMDLQPHPSAKRKEKYNL